VTAAPDAPRGRLGSAAVPTTGEHFTVLADLAGAIVEEITSSSTPDTGSQNQDHDEWVVLLAGAADLELAGERLSLAPGDWVTIPAGTPHRVLRTSAGARWLAVHGRGPGDGRLS
jgi:quercetin dioxygenase-like cupin family protein